ncbi:unnamed protein product [Fusarium graminearum]|uniref:Ferredoxin n=1 Tax=Gibberella zeae (strain ATCC MYA-4620 / CBS 123657 / FGSC 9075 / NRRL 31084 / PH-1) TaxID=229533 RepID=A0A098DPB8_GIBZE|nr:unnamed protein product [Fusarium graminearum]
MAQAHLWQAVNKSGRYAAFATIHTLLAFITRLNTGVAGPILEDATASLLLPSGDSFAALATVLALLRLVARLSAGITGAVLEDAIATDLGEAVKTGAAILTVFTGDAVDVTSAVLFGPGAFQGLRNASSVGGIAITLGRTLEDPGMCERRGGKEGQGGVRVEVEGDSAIFENGPGDPRHAAASLNADLSVLERRATPDALMVIPRPCPMPQDAARNSAGNDIYFSALQEFLTYVNIGGIDIEAYLNGIVNNSTALPRISIAISDIAIGLLRLLIFHQSLNMSYKVTIKTPNEDYTFNCGSDEYILDVAESNGIKLPYSCRAGVYSSCAGKLVSGTIQQDDQDFLDSDQVEAGYVLLCIAYPTSDCIIKANAEDEL